MLKRAPQPKPPKPKPASKKAAQPGGKRVPQRDGLAKFARSVKAI